MNKPPRRFDSLEELIIVLVDTDDNQTNARFPSLDHAGNFQTVQSG
jgi:hypothetical protein